MNRIEEVKIQKEFDILLHQYLHRDGIYTDAEFFERVCQLFPQPKWNCPSDCRHCVPTTGSWDNPEVGGCAVEDKLPAGATLEPDTTLPLCPFYQPQPLDDKELREKIAKEAFKSWDYFAPWEEQPEEIKEMARCKADIYLALLQQRIEGFRLQIEALDKKLNDREADLINAKREERERIFGEINKRHIYLLVKGTQNPTEEDWQALKGGE